MRSRYSTHQDETPARDRPDLIDMTRRQEEDELRRRKLVIICFIYLKHQYILPFLLLINFYR